LVADSNSSITPADVLLGWLDVAAGATPSVHCAGADWSWQAWEHAELARLARATAAGLHAARLRRNDVVALIAPPGAHFVAGLFGTLLAGGTASIVAPPRAFQNAAEYDEHLKHVLATATPRLLITTEELRSALPASSALALPLVTIEALIDSGLAAPTPAGRVLADLALLQFTAGSSGRVRGVRVPYAALAANVTAIRRWLAWSQADAAAFWIPHYHDMGLIGGLFAPLASRCELWLMTPEQFVRRPLEYLRCFGQRGARLTALPTFGLDYVVRRLRPEHLRGCDFSAVKGLIIGAELVDAASLARFQALLEPFGLPPTALLPAYGLAEATLAVTGVPLGQRWSAHAPATGGPAVVGCGPALPGLEITIIDDDGIALPEGEPGEIVVRGPSLAAGYHVHGDSDSLTCFDAHGLRSGDAGFVRAGQLFPLGRLGDSLKIRGRTLYAELLEAELHALGHAREHNAVLLGIRAGRPLVVWISERSGNAEPADAERQARARVRLAHLTEGAELNLLAVNKGTIARTSSGKPRRRFLWNALAGARTSGRMP
jgi:acyl-CoA synthetase (AMP-forming)/AMP-acid ligase II